MMINVILQTVNVWNRTVLKRKYIWSYFSDGGWDFDEMMRRKKAERKRQRRRRGDGIDIINDDDGRIAAMVELMKNATKVGIYFTFNVFFLLNFVTGILYSSTIGISNNFLELLSLIIIIPLFFRKIGSQIKRGSLLLKKEKCYQMLKWCCLGLVKSIHAKIIFSRICLRR